MIPLEDYPYNRDERTFSDQVVVQYNDGELGLKFQTPGDTLVFDSNTSPAFAQGLHGEDGSSMALVKTEKNIYGLGRGVIVNFNAQHGYKMPEELPSISIGDVWVYDIVNRGYTTKVKSVIFRYKSADPGHVDEQIDTPSPFKTLDKDIEILKSSNLIK